MKLRYKITGGAALLLLVATVSLGIVLGYDKPCEQGPDIGGERELMQAIVYRCYGPPEVLRYEEVARPEPADDEVLVKVHAASVNPLDWHYMRGSPYIMRLLSGVGAPRDTRLGTDFAGTVEAAGSKVSRFKPGDSVFGGGNGSFAQYLVVREDRAIAAKPANITFEQAAAVPIAGVTALQALRDKGGIGPGMKVLINGASGGVGTFAVQIAKSFGAEVTGVCSTRNLELVRSLGADHVLDYTSQDYTRSGQKYDLIIDNVGNHSPFANRRALTDNGILVMVGGPSGDWVGPFQRPLQAMLLGPFVEQTFVTLMAEMRGDDLMVLGELMEEGKVTPVIDRRHPLPEVAAAIQYSESGRARGKIAIDVP